MAYLVFAGVALVNVLLVLMVNEHKVQPRLDGGPQEVSCTASEPLPKAVPAAAGTAFSLRPCPFCYTDLI